MVVCHVVHVMVQLPLAVRVEVFVRVGVCVQGLYGAVALQGALYRVIRLAQDLADLGQPLKQTEADVITF